VTQEENIEEQQYTNSLQPDHTNYLDAASSTIDKGKDELENNTKLDGLIHRPSV
jgi:hypothetical protein